MSIPQFSSKEHWDTVTCNVQYIKGAPRKGLSCEDKGRTCVVGYFDAYWTYHSIAYCRLHQSNCFMLMTL